MGEGGESSWGVESLDSIIGCKDSFFWRKGERKRKKMMEKGGKRKGKEEKGRKEGKIGEGEDARKAPSQWLGGLDKEKRGRWRDEEMRDERRETRDERGGHEKTSGLSGETERMFILGKMGRIRPPSCLKAFP